jgi:hypothetical protein
MTTQLKKHVKRISNEARYENGKLRRVIVTLYPAGHIGLRLEGTRREETMPIMAAWERAVKMRLAMEAHAKLQKKAEKAGVPLRVYVQRKKR